MKVKPKVNLRKKLSIKRPLCAAALVWAAVLWLLGQAGVTILGFTPPGLPEGADKENILITGIIYKQDKYQFQSNLYLKHTNLILNSKKYSIDDVKVNIENSKIPEKNIVGSKAAVCGALKDIPLPSNPGQFSERKYYYARRIKWYLDASQIEILKEKQDKILGMQEFVKNKMRQGISASAPEKEAGILEAMLLGEKKNIEETDKILFQIMGISHILAISGIHISVLGWGLFRILRKFHVPVKIAGVIAAAGIFFYGGMTGSSAATIRAAVMFAVSLGAMAAKRTFDFLSAVSLSAILILAENPLYLYDSGFLLSFGAVLGLGIVYPGLFSVKKGNKEDKIREKIKKVLIKGLCSGISVWLALLPVIMYFFFEVPVWGILVNLIVLPISGLLLISGILGCFLGMFPFPAAGQTAVFPAVMILKIFRITGEIIRNLPVSVWITGQPAVWKCGIYYAALAAGLWTKCEGKKLWIWRVFCLVFGFSVLLGKIPDGKTKITFLDVGQGDCACIQTESGNCYLIDGGSSDVSEAGKYRILPFLKAEGIDEIEGVFLSHMDEDHVNGMKELMQMIGEKQTGIKIRRLFLSVCRETEKEREKVEEMGKKAGCEIVYVEKGTVISDGETKIECLSPSGKDWGSNAGSQVLAVSYKEFDVLFTGDIEGQGEKELMKTLKIKGKAGFEVLKTAHHGSRNSTSTEFLQLANPLLAVISCGRENSYGHPHGELLKRLEDENVRILKTPDCGAIFISSDGKNAEVSFQYPGIMVE